jgi:hypothetical protein
VITISYSGDVHSPLVWNLHRLEGMLNFLVTLTPDLIDQEFFNHLVLHSREVLFPVKGTEDEDLVDSCFKQQCYQTGVTCMFLRSVVLSLDQHRKSPCVYSNKVRNEFFLSIAGFPTKSEKKWLKSVIKRGKRNGGWGMEDILIRTILNYGYSFPYFYHSKIEISETEALLPSTDEALKTNFLINSSGWMNMEYLADSIQYQLFLYAALARSAFQ